MTPQSLAQEVHRLFSLPDVAIRINALLAAPDTSTRQLVEVAQLDPALTAMLLKLANSAYYGLDSKVETLSHAIAVVGQNALLNMVTAVSVIKTFTGIPGDVVDMARFWEHSVTCGVLARLLARRVGIGGEENLFVAGLLHAVGKLVFYTRRPQQYRPVLAVRELGSRAVAAREREVFGFDYAELGAALLASWKLPEILLVMVRHHPHPADAPSHAREVALLHVANDIADHLVPNLRSTPREAYQPGFDADAWAALGLDLEVLPELIEAANLQAFELLEIINPDATTIY
jgi:HD-like signal output (HDOD) protein